MRGSVRRFLCAILIGLSAHFAFADQALDDYNLAVQLYNQNRWTQAAETFRKFLRDHALHEKAPYARLYLGLTLVNQSDFKAARDVLRGFVKDYPQNRNLPQAKYRIAECSYLLNDLPAARTELEAYLEDHPQDALVERALPYLGDVQLRLKEPAAAEQTFADAVERFPNGALVEDVKFGWAKALEAQQKFDEALAKYGELAKGTGTRAADAQFQIGARRFEQKQFAEAAAAYRDLAERFPESRLAGDSRLNAGFALFNADQFADAAREFERAATYKGKEITAGYWRGRSLKGAGDHAAAADALSETSARAGSHPLAETILYQRGICERLAGRIEPAQQSLMEVVDKFPAGELADDALHFAAELAIEAGDLPTAAARLAQFEKDYPRSGLRKHQDLLAGRLSLLRATKAGGDPSAAEQFSAAAKRFDSVLKESDKPATRAQARYYLALTRQLQGQHPQALETIAPLIDDLDKSPELADALVLQADSLLQLQQHEPAAAALERYLTRFPPGKQTARALSLSALALTRAMNQAGAAAALERLAKEFPASPIRANTVLQLAELADERQDWNTAADLYRQLQTIAAGTENEVFAWRGLGFAQFQQQKFADAAATFARIAKDFANHRLAPEAAYYRAESLREAGRLAEATAAFVAAFEQGTPRDAPATGEELRPPLLFVFRAGLQAARTYKQAQQVPEADKAYAAVLAKFPKPQNLDRVLDEWALLNYEAERFDESDALFRRLIEEVPDSDLVDNARLSLAESDLLAAKFDAARAALEDLTASERSDADVKRQAQYQLIVLSLQQQRWSEVRERAAKYLAAHPESADRAYIEYCRFEAQLAEPQVAPDALELLLKDIAAAIAATPEMSADWQPRLWVLQAEAQFRAKKYDDIEQTLADYKRRHSKAELGYQIEEIVGRALKQQARFPEAREAFDRVLADSTAFRTETAAKAQFLIGETWLLQEKWAEAFLAYQKVYANYKYPDWQAEALLQSGKCDEQLGQWADAAKTYERLIAEFPQSTRTAEAKQRRDAARKRAAMK